jgi:hypothetical protein
MKVLKQVGSVQLIKGSLMSEGLYRLHDIETDELSLWFDEIEQELFMSLSDNDFLTHATELFEDANQYN